MLSLCSMQCMQVNADGCKAKCESIRVAQTAATKRGLVVDVLSRASIFDCRSASWHTCFLSRAPTF